MYLSILLKHRISPNFWCSEEYFRKASWETNSFDGGLLVTDSSKEVMLPLLNKEYGISLTQPDFIWSDFPDFTLPKPWSPEILDLEYIYQPADFLEMFGNKWATFRKHVKKFPVRLGESLVYRTAKSEDDIQLRDILVEWLEGREDQIQDGDVFLQYILEGENRKVLEGKRIYGVNVWDENWKMINFRFSVCSRHDFLSEYLRYRFYSDPQILAKKKEVNDGGVLDNPALKSFKDKLNPIRIRKVKSWRRR